VLSHRGLFREESPIMAFMRVLNVRARFFKRAHSTSKGLIEKASKVRNLFVLPKRRVKESLLKWKAQEIISILKVSSLRRRN